MTYCTQCVICGSLESSESTSLPFRLSDRTVISSVCECRTCHSFWRTFTDSSGILSHFDIAPYTANDQEAIWKEKRTAIFQQIAAIVANHMDESTAHPTLLDVGCSYGHMIHTFSLKGFSCVGIEPVDRLRATMHERNIAAYHDMNSLPPNSSFDVITFIDSLYNFPNPRETLVHATTLLAEGGILILRVANRTPFLRILRPCRKWKLFQVAFGDQLAALSHRGVLSMVSAAGAHVLAIHMHEARHAAGIMEHILYGGLGRLAKVTHIPISPGIIYVISRG